MWVSQWSLHCSPIWNCSLSAPLIPSDWLFLFTTVITLFIAAHPTSPLEWKLLEGRTVVSSSLLSQESCCTCRCSVYLSWMDSCLLRYQHWMLSLWPDERAAAHLDLWVIRRACGLEALWSVVCLGCCWALSGVWWGGTFVLICSDSSMWWSEVEACAGSRVRGSCLTSGSLVFLKWEKKACFVGSSSSQNESCMLGHSLLFCVWNCVLYLWNMSWDYASC